MPVIAPAASEAVLVVAGDDGRPATHPIFDIIARAGIVQQALVDAVNEDGRTPISPNQYSRAKTARRPRVSVSAAMRLRDAIYRLGLRRPDGGRYEIDDLFSADVSPTPGRRR